MNTRIAFCPNCGASLRADDSCANCGSNARGLIGGLDLGRLGMAQAVQAGLDYYAVLGVDAAAEQGALRSAYQRLRQCFPTDTSRLAAEQRQRLELLEQAWHVLGDPGRRARYDALQTTAPSLVETQALGCPTCTAPYAAGQARCDFCGVALPVEATPQALVPLVADDAEIVDYYALLGLHPTHLLQQPPPLVQVSLLVRNSQRDLQAVVAARRAPGDLEVREAALAAEQRLLLGPGVPAEQRAPLLEQIEVAAWVLTNEQARSSYDGVLLAFWKGSFGAGQTVLLASLRQQAREALGLEAEPVDGAELLRQAAGYESLGLDHEAVAALRQAVAAMPHSAEARYRYGQALLASDPLALGPHELRQALAGFEVASGNARFPDASAHVALCEGLLHRQNGDEARAEAALRQAIAVEPRLAAAWRALAAIALQAGRHDAVLTACRQALRLDGRDEGAYELLVASCWRAGQQGHARDAASRLADLRGQGWDAERVLHALVGN